MGPAHSCVCKRKCALNLAAYESRTQLCMGPIHICRYFLEELYLNVITLCTFYTGSSASSVGKYLHWCRKCTWSLKQYGLPGLCSHRCLCTARLVPSAFSPVFSLTKVLWCHQDWCSVHSPALDIRVPRVSRCCLPLDQASKNLGVNEHLSLAVWGQLTEREDFSRVQL